MNGRGGTQGNAAGQESRRPLLLTTLALLLMVAEPLGVGFYASTILTSVIERGAWAVLLLVVRLAITGFGIGAGLVLWRQRPGGTTFASIAVALTAAGVTLTFLAPVFPHNRPPGTTVPLLAAWLVYYGAWFWYLIRRPAPLPTR